MPIYKYTFEFSTAAFEDNDGLRKYLAILGRNIMIPLPILILSFFPVCDSLLRKEMWFSSRGICTMVYYILCGIWLLAGPWLCWHIYKKRLHKKINRKCLYTIEFWGDYLREVRNDTVRTIYYNEITKYVVDKGGNLTLLCKLAGDLKPFDRVSPGAFYYITLYADIVGKGEIDKVIYFFNSKKKGGNRNG